MTRSVYLIEYKEITQAETLLHQRTVRITCNQCQSSWRQIDGITQGIRCPYCGKWDVTIEKIS